MPLRDPAADGPSGRRRWYAAFTQPQKEGVAAENLAGQGYPVFVPKRLKTVRHARKVSQKRAPYFPRYVFVSLDLGRDRWRSVDGTRGVVALVRAGDRPAAVPETVMAALLDCADKHGCLQLARTWRPGQSVRIADGPFSDHLGVLDRVDEIGAVQILLDLLGGKVRVEIGRDKLLPAA